MCYDPLRFSLSFLICSLSFITTAIKKHWRSMLWPSAWPAASSQAGSPARWNATSSALQPSLFRTTAIKKHWRSILWPSPSPAAFSQPGSPARWNATSLALQPLPFRTTAFKKHRRSMPCRSVCFAGRISAARLPAHLHAGTQPKCPALFHSSALQPSPFRTTAIKKHWRSMPWPSVGRLLRRISAAGLKIRV